MKTIKEALQYLETIGIPEVEITGDFFSGFKVNVNNDEFITSALTLRRLCYLVEDYWNCRGEEYGLEPEAWAGGFANNHWIIKTAKMKTSNKEIKNYINNMKGTFVDEKTKKAMLEQINNIGFRFAIIGSMNKNKS
jgi:hypothetical protein